MRLHRKRQRQGRNYVHILLHVTNIDALIHLGLLKTIQRTDADAPQVRFLGLVYRATECDGNGFDSAQARPSKIAMPRGSNQAKGAAGASVARQTRRQHS
jgi:hypothetical protein